MTPDELLVITLPAIRCGQAQRAAKRAAVETIVPLEMRVSRSRRRKPRLITRAKLPGYLFAAPAAAEHMGEIRSAAGRADIIGSTSSAGIAAMECAAARPLKVGQTVEVQSGLLAGMSVRIAALRGKAIEVTLGGKPWTIPRDDVSVG